LGFNWSANEQDIKSEDILSFLVSIREILTLSDIFFSKLPTPLYTPVSLICYLGKHYLTFILE